MSSIFIDFATFSKGCAICRQASWRAYVSFVFFLNKNLVFLFLRLFQEFVQSSPSNCSSDCFSSQNVPQRSDCVSDGDKLITVDEAIETMGELCAICLEFILYVF